MLILVRLVTTNMAIKIIDLSGRTLYNKQNLNSNTFSERVNFPEGIYIVNVMVDNVSLSKKLHIK